MRSFSIMILAMLLGAGPAHAEDANQVPAGTASAYPPAGGKGPGSGHSYRLGTATRPGQGSPNYQGGRDVGQASPADATTGNRMPDSAPAPSTNDTSEAAAAPASAESLPAAPGPYRRATDQAYLNNSGGPYPYSGGRGRGYGRHQRGYGYGYPGYRGLGGGQYPHHRQFGNPPIYPAVPALGTPPASVE